MEVTEYVTQNIMSAAKKAAIILTTTILLVLGLFWILGVDTKPSQHSINTSPAVTRSNDVTSAVEKYQKTEMGDPSTPTEVEPLASFDASDQRSVVKIGSLTLETSNIRDTVSAITSLVNTFGGFVASTSISDSLPMPFHETMVPPRSDARQPLTATLSVKVPSTRFEEVMGKLRDTGRVLNESSTLDDATEQVLDIEAQLKNKRSEEAAFVSVLENSAQKVSDILEVTRELSRVRGEIERLEAQKKYWASQTEMATIHISLTEETRIGTTTNEWRPSQIVKKAANDLLSSLRTLFDGVLYFTIARLPLIVALMVVAWTAYLMIRRKSLRG